MTKKVLIVEGSPRRNGNSVLLGARAAEGLREGDVEVETIHLQGMNIHSCLHCDGCIRKKLNCTQQDDMQSLYPKLLEANGLILSSPIYWFTYNAQMKTFIDRWYGLWQNQHDFLEGKPVGVILTYGDTDEFTSGAINAIHTFETMFNFLQTRPPEFVHGSAMDEGDVMKDGVFMDRAFQLGKKMGALLKE